MNNAHATANTTQQDAANDSSLAGVLLASAAKILQPLVRLLITHGVTYQMASELLKRVYVDAARTHFVEKDASDTRLSLLTGINRKEIRRLCRDDEAYATPDSLTSFASAIYAKWRTTKRYLDEEGKPLKLSRRSINGEVSFDELVRSVTTDYRPSAVLFELQRLGTVEVVAANNIAGEQIYLKPAEFLPQSTLVDRIQPVTESLQDHSAAAISNLLTEKPLFLDRYVAADELSVSSANILRDETQVLWQQVQRQLLSSAIECEAADAATPGTESINTRVRVGMYFYAETKPVTPTGENHELR
jgi:Family of unknown function (DUF6502)